jgi:hypothetical protein
MLSRVHSVHCELIYKLLSAPTSAQLYILYILLLICCYVFRWNRHLQGTYTKAVKTNSKFYNDHVQVLDKIYSTENVTIKL